MIKKNIHPAPILSFPKNVLQQRSDQQFWEFFFQTENMIDSLSHEDERFVIEVKYQTGEKKTIAGIRLKKSLKKCIS